MLIVSFKFLLSVEVRIILWIFIIVGNYVLSFTQLKISNPLKTQFNCFFQLNIMLNTTTWTIHRKVGGVYKIQKKFCILECILKDNYSVL